MHVTVDTAALRAALKSPARAASRGDLIPILGHLRLTASGGTLMITGTNLDMWATSDLPCEVASEGAACIPASMLSRAVGSDVFGSETSVRVDGDAVEIVSGRAKVRVETLPVADFPTPEDFVGADIEVDGAALKAALSATLATVSTEESRYYLNGVYVDAAHPSLTLIATDGHRLTRAVVDVASEGLEPCIIPSAGVARIVESLGAGSVRLSSTMARWRLSRPGLTLGGKTIDCVFPDYERIMPILRDGCDMPADSLADTLRLMQISEDRKKVTNGVRIAPGADGFTLSMRGGGASSECTIDATPHDGMASIGVNGKYLEGLCANLGETPIHLAWGAADSPIYWSGRRGGVDLDGCLMPMRV